MKTSENVRRASKAYRDAKTAQGICGACGVRPLVNKHRCKECQDKANAYAKMRREINIDAGFNCSGEPRGTPRKKKPK